ncbi:hypothetical protein BC832DRAFT_34153 [Gaertneriomyces semiglobifer]|nr:hypothetical protein BC832DRAFT_34153 [Gaertneriomyces semiglobifer]
MNIDALVAPEPMESDILPWRKTIHNRPVYELPFLERPPYPLGNALYPKLPPTPFASDVTRFSPYTCRMDSGSPTPGGRPVDFPTPRTPIMSGRPNVRRGFLGRYAAGHARSSFDLPPPLVMEVPITHNPTFQCSHPDHQAYYHRLPVDQQFCAYLLPTMYINPPAGKRCSCTCNNAYTTPLPTPHTPHIPSLTLSPSPSDGDKAQPTAGRAVRPSKRRKATPKQLAVLTAVLSETFFPSTKVRHRIAHDIGMTPRAVQIWFQNRRQKWRNSNGAATRCSRGSNGSGVRAVGSV